MKSAALNMRIDAELMARIKASAKRENRTITNYVETILLQATGVEKKARKRPAAEQEHDQDQPQQQHAYPFPYKK